MKQVVVKKAVKETKVAKLSLEDQIDSLARIVISRFDQIDERFEQIDVSINSRFEKVDKKFELMEENNNTEFVFIRHELKDHRERLERIERKQVGVLETLDESVHRSEFKGIVRRIEALEAKRSK